MMDDFWIKHHRENGYSYDEIRELPKKLGNPAPFSWEAPPERTDLSRWFSAVAQIDPSTCTDAIGNQYPVYTLALYLLRLIADGEQSARPGALHANRIREDACDQLRYAGLFIRRHSSHDIWWYDIDVPAVVAWAVRVIKKYEDSQEEKWKVNHPMTTPTAERAEE